MEIFAKYIGYESFIKELLNDKNNYIAIRGKTGTGKTAIATDYADYNGYEKIFFNCSFEKSNYDLNDVIKKLKCGYDINAMINFKKKRFCFIIDDFDLLDQSFQKELVMRIFELKGVKVILTFSKILKQMKEKFEDKISIHKIPKLSKQLKKEIVKKNVSKLRDINLSKLITIENDDIRYLTNQISKNCEKDFDISNLDIYEKINVFFNLDKKGSNFIKLANIFIESDNLFIKNLIIQSLIEVYRHVFAKYKDKFMDVHLDILSQNNNYNNLYYYDLDKYIVVLLILIKNKFNDVSINKFEITDRKNMINNLLSKIVNIKKNNIGNARYSSNYQIYNKPVKKTKKKKIDEN